MSVSGKDWFLIRRVLKNLADDQRENEKASVSSDMISADTLEKFISDIDQIVGS